MSHENTSTEHENTYTEAEFLERYLVAGGIRLFGVEAGEGPLVLLLHGFPEFWWSWHRQIDALARAGFRAIAVDLPGYGRSDKPARPYDLEFLCRVLAEVPSALGHTKMVVCGHDWGGILVWSMARMYPDVLAGVVGVNTPDIPRPPAPPIRIMRERFSVQPNYILQFQIPGAAEFFAHLDLENFFRLMFLGPATRQKQVFTPEVVRRYVDQFRPVGAMTPPLDYYRQLDRNWELTREIADRLVELPALMVVAENDPVLTPAMADGMERRVPNVEKVSIPDCGHWTQLEKPEELSRALITFLRSLAPWD